MSHSIIDRMSEANVAAMLEYLTEQLEDAETKEDIQAVLELARQLLDPPALHNAVHGLEHIRAEYAPRPSSAANTEPQIINTDAANLSNVINLEVPHILTNTFKALSDRMNTLQARDPETFANATSALTWLANGEITSNQN